MATAEAWCDDCAPTVRAVVSYFGGPETAGLFDAGRQTDPALERRVLASVPYVRSLRLSEDRFLLVAPSSILNRRLRDVLVAVDDRLTAGQGLSACLVHPTAVTDAYSSVRQVCNSQVIGCEDRLRNDLYCVGWGVKLYILSPIQSVRQVCIDVGLVRRGDPSPSEIFITS